MMTPAHVTLEERPVRSVDVTAGHAVRDGDEIRYVARTFRTIEESGRVRRVFLTFETGRPKEYDFDELVVVVEERRER